MGLTTYSSRWYDLFILLQRSIKYIENSYSDKNKHTSLIRELFMLRFITFS